MIDGEKRLHILDRKNLFLELYVKGRSVWIPTGKVESLFQQSLWVAQLYIHGDRAQDSLIAVVVPRHSQVLTYMSAEVDTNASTATGP